MPDGKHDQLFEYLFCCRDDGNKGAPIALPNTKAFMLWRGKSGCQEVEGMDFANFGHVLFKGV